jgi:hypothetical protein
MNSKLKTFILITVAILIVVCLEIYNSSEPKKPSKPAPPKATFHVGKTKLAYKSGNYVWVKEGTGFGNIEEEPLELLNDLSYTPVSPFGNLEFSFEKEPDIVEIATWAEEYGQINEEGLYLFPLEKNEFPIPNNPGNIFFVIRAVWDKTEVQYVVPIGVERVMPYQHLLSEEKGMYSLLEVNLGDQSDDSLLGSVNTSRISGSMGSGAPDIEMARGMYPDLDIQSLPYFALFDDRDIVFETNKREEMIAYLESLENTD